MAKKKKKRRSVYRKGRKVNFHKIAGVKEEAPENPIKKVF